MWAPKLRVGTQTGLPIANPAYEDLEWRIEVQAENSRNHRFDAARVLQNEANGLGFFSAEGAGGASGGNVLFWQGPAAALPLGHPPVQAVPATPYAPGAPPTPPVVAPVAAPARR